MPGISHSTRIPLSPPINIRRRAAKRVSDASREPQGLRVHRGVLPPGAHGDGHVCLPGE